MQWQAIVALSLIVVSHRRQLKSLGALRIHAHAASTPYQLACLLAANVKRHALLAGVQVC